MEMPDEEMSKDGWVCQECYSKLDKEYECYTDANFFKEKCPYCKVFVGKYHIMKLPTGPQQSDSEPPTPDAKGAGPNEDERTRLLNLINIEQEKLKLLEV